MPQVVLESTIAKNTGLPITVSQFKSRYFFGIPILAPDGSLMADEDLEFYIRSATETLETELDIKIPLQVVQESKQFLWDEYNNWSYVKASYPIVCVESVEGFVGTVRQVDYPKEWITIQKSTDGIRHRRISIVPNTNQGTIINQNIIYAGIYPQLGYYGTRNIPSYWNITYTTGFQKVPEDINKAIGMMSAIGIFDQLGDTILGAGIASQSLGLDGLSQSISSTSSATNAGYGARITSYQKQLKEMMPQLKKKYSGVIFGAA